ncbi:hypothetical protein TNCV_3100011 [Trichonephila clavipes]|nr:hypothetical protein TNCV_3100011 [Trichonephila clavipes]
MISTTDDRNIWCIGRKRKFKHLVAPINIIVDSEFSNALACINGFPISDDNYGRALDLLKDRFGNKNILTKAHLSNLLNLTPVRNPTDISV